MSGPLPAQPYPDRFPFEKTVKQSLWLSILECTFFLLVLVPGAFIWLAWQRIRQAGRQS